MALISFFKGFGNAFMQIIYSFNELIKEIQFIKLIDYE